MSQQNIAILALPLTLSGTVAANRFITAAGAQAGADAVTFGAARSAGVSGEKITADIIGTAIIEAGAAFSLGATLKSDSTGRAITWVTSGAKVAIALQAAAAAGQMVEVLLLPNA
jgi:hypothetical protein